MEKKNTCNLDHTIEDVQKKYEAIKPHLPENSTAALALYLAQSRTQEELNEVFHLLKKYDLADVEEQARRNAEFARLLF
ncbi:hypothetical protein DFP93_11381 [Aneurinibacillus soli]|uniref:Uncharacterized protein n=1 Tax=Aneurinibacillus soli TaxID=1500254 RepID=A0A0U5B905_9BACL|nr:group-specific protein [Aneurinibacillus soli]PYE60371.1 hypothetical protein DFP93_11381 [Aneurinibacillus soli]BAU27229.1 hypothetical protein CB4_01398 [Aneurinibacillus soli]